jgi:hypothetical protein
MRNTELEVREQMRKRDVVVREQMRKMEALFERIEAHVERIDARVCRVERAERHPQLRPLAMRRGRFRSPRVHGRCGCSIYPPSCSSPSSPSCSRTNSSPRRSHAASCAVFGSMGKLEWAVPSCGLPLDNGLLVHAARGGQLEQLSWLRARGIE